MTHQNVSGPEQVAEGVVEQVDEGRGVQVRVAHHLGGKQSLPRATAEQTAHHAVAHIHVVGDFLGERDTHVYYTYVQYRKRNMHIKRNIHVYI